MRIPPDEPNPIRFYCGFDRDCYLTIGFILDNDNMLAPNGLYENPFTL